MNEEHAHEAPESLGAPNQTPVLARSGSEWRIRAQGPSGKRLVLAGIGAMVLAYLFDMPLTGASPELPIPTGMLFTAGTVAHQALRQHRALQQLLLPPVVALFFAFGLPLLLTPFAPGVRYVFYLVIAGSAVALFEWSMP